MRKDEVGAAGVNIERRPQIARAHDGALDVPARAPGSPRARPRGLSRRLRLPEHEVERIALARVVGMIAARVGHRQHLRARKVAEPAEGRPVAHGVVHAAPRDIGEAALDQRGSRGHDVGDDIGRAGIVIRRTDVELLHVTDEVRGPAIAQSAPVLPDVGRLAQDVVVDVSDVLDVAYGQALTLQMPHEHVGDRVGEGMAQVGRVVGSDAADVEADRAAGWPERLEGLVLRVVEVHGGRERTAIDLGRTARICCAAISIPHRPCRWREAREIP